MAKTTRPKTRARRTVREELTNPIPPDDSSHGEESTSEFNDNEEPDMPNPRIVPAEAYTPKTQRLSLPLTADGKSVDWERVRNAEKARSVLGFQEAAATVAQADGLFGADMLGMALDMLSNAMVSTFKAAGYTVDSSEAARLTDADKAALVPRYEKILAKHAPALGKYEDEIMAGVATLIVFGGKMMLLKKAGTVSKFPRPVEQPDASVTTVPIDPALSPLTE